MPLDDLVSVIETLKARLQTHRQVLQANETRTRMALIDPLLQALGWDTADPALVLPEYDLSGRQAADYALLDAAGKPVAVIQAKRLGESLEQHRIQFISYANEAGVQCAGLTDGNQWEFHQVSDHSPIEGLYIRRILNVSITDCPAYECVLELLHIWQPKLASDQRESANKTFAAMADLIVEKRPIGPFRSTDCLPIIREGWPDHPMVSMDSGSFGKEFDRKLWPLLEDRGVKKRDTQRRQYEMTAEAKAKIMRIPTRGT